MKLTECVNCGSPLIVCKCKRCGTEYDDSGVHASFMEDDIFGTLKVGGVEYDVYLADFTCKHVFWAGVHDVKHKFVLIER